MTLRVRITLLTLALLAFSLLLIGGSVYGLLWGILYTNLRSELSDSSENALRLLNQKGSIADLPLTTYGQVLWLTGEPSPKDLSQNPDAATVVERTVALGANSIRLSERAYGEIFKTLQGVYTDATLLLDQGRSVPLRVRAVYLEASITGLLVAPQPLILMVGKSTEGIQTTLSQFAQTYTATALLVLILGGFLAHRLVRQTLEPLEWVAKKAEQVSDKPDKLPELEGNNEVSSLVKSLNRMLTRLETSWETQSRFLLDASHELRTPVTAILGHVGYLLRRTSMTEQQRESLDIIKRESERMQKLVGDLLELSKTGGSWKVELGPVHIGTVLGEIEEEYGLSVSPTETQAEGTGRILVEAPDDLWVLGDPERLHQVFANLVSNAIKAGSTRVRLAALDLQERVVVRVEDNGEGIAAEHLPHLFERFYRVDKARDREHGGSGLGLAIVRSIVEAHGGTVWAESEVAKGSVFSVSLRRTLAPEPQLT